MYCTVHVFITVLDYVFNTLNLSEIASFTAAGNTKSRRVMEKIGLKHNESDDFDNPKLADGSFQKRHVLYRLTREHYFAKERL